jgi:glycosyltransferase involved in cell wall biosynthesis
MASNNVIISLYPLTTIDVERISQLIGGVKRQIVLSNITANGYFDVLRILRTINADYLCFSIPNISSHSLVPLFKVLGMVSSSKNKSIVMPDLSLVHLDLISGLKGCLEIFYGVIINSILLLIEYFKLSRLLRAPRVKISGKYSKCFLYLKHTLWMGLQTGGSIAHARGVIKGLLAAGKDIDLLALDSQLPIHDGGGLTHIESKTTSPYIVPRVLNFSQFNKKALDALLSEPFRRYGAIYQRLSPGNFSGVVLSRLRKTPLIIEYNGSETWLAKNWGGGLSFSWFVEKAERVCLKHAHLVVTVSDVLKEELIERGVEPERIVSYPNGVDPEEFNSERYSDADIRKIRGQLDVPEEAILLTFVGTFGHWHGVEFMADVLTRRANENPKWLEERNIYVCFVGDGVKRHEVDEMIARCSLANRFKITGMVSQDMTPQYMAASDILISPHVPNPDGSPFFGSPTKLFEYMASGRPIIASDLAQIGDVLAGAPNARELPPIGSMPSQGECGVLVEPESEEDMILAIEFLIENAQWRRAAGENARARALSRYTWVRHGEEIVRGLDRVLTSQKLVEKKPTKILLNALHAKTGGGVTYLKNIVPLIVKNPNFDLHLCIHEDQLDIFPETIDKISLHTFSFKSGFWRLPFWEQVQIPKLAREIGADVTFSPANYGPFFAPNTVIMLRNALGVAFVERRPVKIAYWLLVSIGTLISMLMCRRGIAVSNYARQSNFGPISGILRSRFNIVPHGVNKIFSKNAMGANRQDYILAVSDIYVQKNLKNLLNAIAILRLKKPNIKLKIAGRFVDETYHQELNELISEKGIETNIEFLGGVYEGELVDLYHHCAVFVFPSTVETFGNPLIEAMASGAPIATSNTAAMPEVAGNAALYFDPYDVEDMASCIGRLMDNKDLCGELTQKALARAENYSWEKTTESTLDILYQAANEAPQ